MNKSFRIALAAAALGLGALSGMAYADEPTVLEPVKLQKQMSAPIVGGSMQLLSGVYRLEDGRDLRVDAHGLRLRLTLADDAVVTMAPAANGVWNSANGELHARFHGEAWGRPDTVVLTMPRTNWRMSAVNLR